MAAIVNRGLPERSKLQFFFPNPSEGETNFVVTLPFFENPRITERKKARYQTYKTVSRSSNLYSYLGADSREFNLQFNMTLNHIADSGAISLERYLPILRGELVGTIERNKFFEPSNPIDPGVESPAERHALNFRNLANIKDSAAQVLTSEYMQRGINTTDGAAQAIQERYGVNTIINETETNDLYNTQSEVVTALNRGPLEQDLKLGGLLKVVYLVIYWVNIIRSSVVNNAENPIYGPPIIRLNHGIMYEDVPCICKDYQLSMNEQAGYDLDTLLPRQITITMRLEEIRTGNFGVFDPQSYSAAERDNLGGWEAVINKPTRSADPGSAGRVY